MSESKFEILYKGNTSHFETYLLDRAEQELRIGKQSIWCKVADMYARQLTIISINPFPESILFDSDETPPSLKQIIAHTNYTNFYRWGIKGGKTGNHPIIYAIHNYHKVILLHYFNKQYNGLINRRDILPAEKSYSNYCEDDPNLY